MPDFTLDTYRKLLIALQEANYRFITFEEYFTKDLPEKLVILRHDVDRAPKNAVKMATIEHELNIRASYYYRVVAESYNENTISEVVRLKHELGYHYEDLSLAKGNEKQALKLFEKHLTHFRKFYPVRTMCMHGSPMSKWDNRELWKKNDYRNYAVIAEPYFDLDFNAIFYITDASRSWNNTEVTLRDKVDTKFHFEINNTGQIIKLLKNNKLPNQLMISTHPHNWADGNLEWLKIMLWQGFKNQIKKILVQKSI
jgi:hypothetical protein